METRSEMTNCGRPRSALQVKIRDKEEEEELVICPKPQRVVSISEILKPVRQRRGMISPAVDFEAGNEILEIFLSKNTGGDSSFGCSPPYFSGSPPSRAGNPLVRDAEFSHLQPPSSLVTHPKSSKGPSFRASPSVRVEGFECSGRKFECSGRDARCQVPAFA